MLCQIDIIEATQYYGRFVKSITVNILIPYRRFVKRISDIMLKEYGWRFIKPIADIVVNLLSQ